MNVQRSRLVLFSNICWTYSDRELRRTRTEHLAAPTLIPLKLPEIEADWLLNPKKSPLRLAED
ncbi:MAG: hypothetical protein HC926_02630 [Synechococcaceae cyanobacterium SM2_3_60]|nr:hypothetical protein [Synechococcaceae cyanobacterium SM2_3_60]